MATINSCSVATRFEQLNTTYFGTPNTLRASIKAYKELRRDGNSPDESRFEIIHTYSWQPVLEAPCRYCGETLQLDLNGEYWAIRSSQPYTCFQGEPLFHFPTFEGI